MQDRQLTQVLSAAAAGDDRAAERLLPMVYGELRKLAVQWMAKTPPGQTLQPTALVHEAYLYVADQNQGSWDGRKHFFFAASRAMRDILVEQARRKAAVKRGGDRQRVEVADYEFMLPDPPEDLLALHSALARLEQEDPDAALVVNLKYFSGLTHDQTAELLSLSSSTVRRRWRFARAWLHEAMNAEGDEHQGTDDG